jgi:putative transposase
LISYIDQHKEVFGVEPICRVLTAQGCKIAPSTYYARKKRPPSSRSLQDLVWIPILMAIFVTDYRVYGAHNSGKPPAVMVMTSVVIRSLG